MIFQNISELISIFKQNEVSYTLLTNGMNVMTHFKSLTEYKPKKITFSYHSKKKHEEIFGVKYNTEVLDESIRMICENEIDTTVSLLLLPINLCEIYSQIIHLIDLGVKSIKLIYPNDASIKSDLLTDFNKMVDEINKIDGIEFRYSDTKNQTCNLLERGFISYTLNNEKIYGCCNSVSHDDFIKTFNSKTLLSDILWDFYQTSRYVREFPCESYVEFCPIALNC